MGGLSEDELGEPGRANWRPGGHGISPTPTIPDYTLLRVIGRGSYGEVWLARNTISQMCAVKIIHRCSFENDRPFEREFSGIQNHAAVARSHPNLIQVLHVGRDDSTGCFYYVMELADPDPTVAPTPSLMHGSGSIAWDGARVEGYAPRTLRSDLRRRGRLPSADCVELGLALAGALRHLHAHGLVHRDVKPSNVVYVSGAPKLADFGLLAPISNDRSFVGTEGFIPPEGPGAITADLYALGKLLYEASTGKDRNDYPEPVTELGELPDRVELMELNAVIHKACSPKFADRQRSSSELQSELEWIASGRSVRQKRRHSMLSGRVRRWTGMLVGIAILLMAADWIRGRFQAERRGPKGNGEPIHPLAIQLVQQAEAASPTTRQGFDLVLNFCHQAIALSPEYAQAHVVLANAYREAAGWHRPEHQSMLEARQAARRAIQLDNTNVGAYIQIALIEMLHAWDFVAAENAFKHGLSIEPTNIWHLVAYADFKRSMGQTSEARRLVNEAARLGANQVGVTINHLTDQALQFHAERNFTAMLATVEEMRAARPDSILPKIYAGLALVGLGRVEEALVEFESARTLEDAPDLMALTAYCLGRLGRRSESLGLLRRLDSLAPVFQVSPYFRAYVHAGLSDTNALFTELELAAQQRSAHLVGYSWRGVLEDSIWDAYRADPRWTALLKRVGLPRIGQGSGL